MKIRCEMCGREVERGHACAKFCFECLKIRNREYVRQGHLSNGAPNIKKCARCGKEFAAKGNQRYCSKECAAQVRHEQQVDCAIARRKKKSAQMRTKKTELQYSTAAATSQRAMVAVNQRRLTQLLHTFQFSKDDFLQRSPMMRNTANKILRGEKVLFKTIAKLAKFFCVPVEELIKETDYKESSKI